MFIDKKTYDFEKEEFVCGEEQLSSALDAAAAAATLEEALLFDIVWILVSFLAPTNKKMTQRRRLGSFVIFGGCGKTDTAL